MVKLMRMRWVGYLARKGEKMNTCKMLAGKAEGKKPLGGHKRRQEIILKWALKKYHRITWTGLKWLRIGTNEGLL
jgi:hypothetical protein